MNYKVSLRTSLKVFLALALFSGATTYSNPNTNGGLGYNPGMDPTTEMGRRAIQIWSTIPEHGYFSEHLTDAQKYRKDWGAVLGKTDFTANSITAIATGQDAVDDAEAAKLPGTGHGYAQRVQAILNFIGLHYSISGNNASSQTIKAQYGMFGYPILKVGADGKMQVVFEKYINSHQWAMFHGDDSVVRQHREAYWEYLIENNPETLKLWILFGGFSHDSFAKFLMTRGFRIPTRTSADELSKYRVIETREVFAGGNNNFPVIQTKEGKDFYQLLLGDKKIDYKNIKDQERIIEAMKTATPEMLAKIAISGGGIADSGMIDPGQFGGYALDKAEVFMNGKWVPANNSLRGLQLRSGKVIDRDIAFLASQHPTAMGEDSATASRKVNELFRKLEPLEARGFEIPVDTDKDGKPFPNSRKLGERFSWDKAQLPLEVHPFGAPVNLVRPDSSPDRMGSDVLIVNPPNRQDLAKFGIRNLDALFDTAAIEAAKNVRFTEPSLMHPNDLWSHSRRQSENNSIFSRGPGARLEQIMKSNLDPSLLAPKDGMQVVHRSKNADGEEITIDKTLRTNGLAAYNIKSAPNMKFFAHYRGDVVKPRAFVLADPADLEDRNTFIAHSGERGQHIEGMLREMGISDSAFILKTVPVDMIDATAVEWEAVRKPTEKYREDVLKEILSKGSIEVLVADGPVAQAELKRIVAKLGIKNIPIVHIDRGATAADGILAAQVQIRKILKYAQVTLSGKPVSIPITHQNFLARAYEGNAVGTVVRSNHPNFADMYAVVIPKVVTSQKVNPLPSTSESIGKILKYFQEQGIRRPGMNVSDYVQEREMLSRQRARPQVVEERAVAPRASLVSLSSDPRGNPQSRGMAAACMKFYGH
ncbi:MAG: hypothetical protein JNL11_17535 [Bdellovibrionaceae bacterium]|nr:hypothetical protein [Pseudobdellovibrionaceae bacterium]